MQLLCMPCTRLCFCRARETTTVAAPALRAVLAGLKAVTTCVLPAGKPCAWCAGKQRVRPSVTHSSERDKREQRVAHR